MIEWEKDGREILARQPDLNQRPEVPRFTDQARESLEKRGYLIYSLTGQSIRSLREAGRPFWSTWHQRYPDFEKLPSRLSEVAINPDPEKFFLPKSNNKTLIEQERLVEDYSKQLTKKVVGVRAILGNAADYTELIFAHLDATGEYLFGEMYNYDYTRTKTPTVGPHGTGVGSFFAGSGLNVHSWHRAYGNSHLWAVPLVVPVTVDK